MGPPEEVILLDTSVLVDALTGRHQLAAALAGAIGRGERIGLSTLALYEWLRGPRTERELSDQEELLPASAALPFGASEAVIAAGLHRRVARARQRERDLAIAAVAIGHDATLWTLNLPDFRDIPGLRLYTPPA
jgi:predicted nucleic acid-binding protein